VPFTLALASGKIPYLSLNQDLGKNIFFNSGGPNEKLRSLIMTKKSTDKGDKAGFVMPFGKVAFGDDFEPERYEYEIEFDLGSQVIEGCQAHLSMMTKGVDFNYNKVYLNNHEVGRLSGSEGETKWRPEAFRVDVNIVQKGKNTLKITARNATGGTSGNIDDFSVRNPLLIYALA
jgi:hypothetical protein